MYLMERVEEHWMQDLMVALQEITVAEVRVARSCGGSPDNAADGEAAPPLALAPQNVAGLSGGERSTEDDADPNHAIEALKWTTRCTEMSVLENLRRELPLALVKQQVRLYDARSMQARSCELKKVTCRPFLVKSRDDVCKALDEHLSSCGLDRSCRFPKRLVSNFLTERVVFTGYPLKAPGRTVQRWFRNWVKNGAPGHEQAATRSKRHSRNAVAFEKRRRREGGQGHPAMCLVIREQLFEWWQGLRYSVDWKALSERNRSRGCRKALARFPRAAIRAKALELIEAYVGECLIHGVGATVVSS